MKLLLDQNLSLRLVREFQDLFPGSLHVREAGLDRAGDDVVWAHARRENYMIVSKDSDFQQRSLLHGPPPKCVWIRVGGLTCLWGGLDRAWFEWNAPRIGPQVGTKLRQRPHSSLKFEGCK